MPSKSYSKVITANALLNGDVIYLNAKGGWTRQHSNAKIFHAKKDAQTALNTATAQASHVVGAYLADFTDEDAGPKPAHFREVFRTKGPGNYFHGKQAEAKNVSV
ncbi:DUF2849 domain-containing protein [Rhodobacteraceae bacterium]|nr:DUF2849 domain-containing protein [Paracoccaceae bacterium]